MNPLPHSALAERVESDARPSSPATPGVTPSTKLIGGRYALGRSIGRGSSAIVYEATDLHLARPVNVKVLDAIVAADPSLRSRFERQAHKAMRLNHPHIAAVLDTGFWVDQDDPRRRERPYVVTEPAGAGSVRDLLQRRGRLAPVEAVDLACQVASALEYAHSEGLIHADVKPENVLVDERDRNARVVDFSLSFVAAQTGMVTAETLARRAAYLAPEQVRGQQVTPQADVYGLGALLYEMLVGRPPFTGQTPMAVAERRMYEHARPAGMFDPSIPPALEKVVCQALERDKEQRWPTMTAFAGALGALDARKLKPSAAAVAPRDVEVATYAPLRPAYRSGHLGLASIVLPFLALGLAISLGITFLRPMVEEGPSRLAAMTAQVPVPDLSGASVDQARAEAEALGMDFMVMGERPHTAPRGTVIQQTPVAGFQVAQGNGTPLRVTLSAGSQAPDVRGQTLDQARESLGAAGWRVARIEYGSQPGQPRGTVFMQHPAPGEAADPAGEIHLVVAE